MSTLLDPIIRLFAPTAGYRGGATTTQSAASANGNGTAITSGLQHVNYVKIEVVTAGGSPTFTVTAQTKVDNASALAYAGVPVINKATGAVSMSGLMTAAGTYYAFTNGDDALRTPVSGYSGSGTITVRVFPWHSSPGLVLTTPTGQGGTQPVIIRNASEVALFGTGTPGYVAEPAGVYDTPMTVSLTEYTANDNVGGLISITGATVANNGFGWLDSFQLLCKVWEARFAMRAWVFSAAPTAPTDNEPWTITDTDAEKLVCGPIDLANWEEILTTGDGNGRVMGVFPNSLQSIPYDTPGSTTLTIGLQAAENQTTPFDGAANLIPLAYYTRR